jgi:hypothetical protein
MPEQTRPVFIDGFYEKLVEGGINYFFPSATLQVIEAGVEPAACCMTDSSDQTSLILTWLGSRYSLTRNEAFSAQELKLLKGIGAVLDSRYRMIADTDRTEQRFELFRGLPEDRYVSASIDGAPYIQDIWQGPDRSKIRLKSFGPALSAHTRTGVSRRVRCCSENTPIRAMSRRSRLSAHCAILPRSPQFAVSIVSVTGCRH